jgi:hypothetical protein
MGNEFWIRIVADIVLFGLLGTAFSGWLNYKFNKKLKGYEPLTAEEILKRENFLNSKREVFFELINLLNRSLASTTWSGPQVPLSRKQEGTRPSEIEINSCFSKLCLYVDSKEILERFPYIFTGDISPFTVGEFINLIRKDLGYGENIISPEKYPYVFNSK